MTRLCLCMQKNETALLFATQRIEVRIVEELVKAGADPNFKTEVSPWRASEAVIVRVAIIVTVHL